MRCGRMRRRLYLYRSGELDDRETSELERHLAACEVCSAELKRLMEFDRRIEAVRTHEPIVERPDELADTVMEQIRISSATAPRRQRSRADNQLTAFLFSPVLRRVCVGLALTVTALAIGQEILLLGEVNSFDNRLANAGPDLRPVPFVYSLPSKAISGYPELQRLETLILGNESVKEGGVVMIAPAAIERFLDDGQPEVAGMLRLGAVLGTNPEKTLTLLRSLESRVTLSFRPSMQRR